MQMPHGHLFRNHTPWAQWLIKARTCPPASQSFRSSITATHKAQAVQNHPKTLPAPIAAPERSPQPLNRLPQPIQVPGVENLEIPDNTKAPPPVVIQIGNQTLIGLLIDRLGANLISRVAGRDDGNARVDNFFRSDRALETSGPEGGVHGLSLQMSEMRLRARRWAPTPSETS